MAAAQRHLHAYMLSTQVLAKKALPSPAQRMGVFVVADVVVVVVVDVDVDMYVCRCAAVPAAFP